MCSRDRSDVQNLLVLLFSLYPMHVVLFLSITCFLSSFLDAAIYYNLQDLEEQDFE
jgi:hypothetical protein